MISEATRELTLFLLNPFIRRWKPSLTSEHNTTRHYTDKLL